MKYKKYLVYSLIIAILYYLLPFIPYKNFMVMSLLVFYPLANLLLAIIFFKKSNWDWLLPFISAALFLPAVFTHYNESALVYVIVYFVFNLIGCLFSYFFKRNSK